ncbi:hypothetical protein D3C73_616060 [compost metagenome]
MQLILRSLVVNDEQSQAITGPGMDSIQAATPEMMKAGVILFATLPIMLTYPFLQRYFVKGAMLGSIKE